MHCGRRDDAYSTLVYDGADEWREHDGYPICSYCGSLSPEALFAAIEQGVELGPTDKNYKMYVDLPSKDPTKLRVVSASNFDDGSQRVADLPQPLYQCAVEDGYGSRPDTTWVRFAARDKTFGKFYFQHFSEEDKKRFIGMINANTLNIGEPGYFYRLPFFVTKEQRGNC